MCFCLSPSDRFWTSSRTVSNATLEVSVLNLKFDFIADGGCTREEQIALSLKRHLFPHGGREPKAFWICFSRVHPPSEIKSNFKFKTLKRHLLKRHLTLSECGLVIFTHGWFCCLRTSGLVSFAYGWDSVWSFLLTVIPSWKSNIWSSLLTVPPPQVQKINRIRLNISKYPLAQNRYMQEKILEELIFARIHVGPVFALVRIQENIFEELFFEICIRTSALPSVLI